MSEQQRDDQPVVQARDLRKTFKLRNSGIGGQRMFVPAVDGVSFEIARGETLALVGESGSGKSTLSRLLLRLYELDGGELRLLGRDVHRLPERAFRPFRRHIQMVFQNPLASFDPLRTIGETIADAMALTEPNREKRNARVGELLTLVGLSPRFARLRPRSVSGGELQRASIARAIANEPDILVLDEPTSALDMSIRGQVLVTLRELQQKRGLAYLLVTHDLRMVELLAHRVMVMYLGQIVESGTTKEVFGNPRHPYTMALLQASELSERGVVASEKTMRLRGSLRYPRPGDVGCRLRERCPVALEHGCDRPQELAELSPGHLARCWRAAEGHTFTEGAIRTQTA